MKKQLSVLMVCLMSSLISPGLLLADCPQAPNDNGVCDTLNLKCVDCYQTGKGPYLVRFPLFVTHDVPDPAIDSIAAFVIPLCYSHSNPAKFCSTSVYWNNATSFMNPRSIFRHLVVNEDTIYNWIMDLYDEGNEEEWNVIILDLTGGISHFWLTLIPQGTEDQKFGEGSNVLLATMTFRIEDTMHVAIDTCLWPPSSNIAFSRSDGWTYVPRTNLPHSFWIGPPRLQVVYPNGGESWAVGDTNYITWLSENFDGANVKIEYCTTSEEKWESIIGSTPNDGSYAWLIPDNLSDECKVRISDANDGDPSDKSDSYFSIILRPDFTIEAKPDTQTVDAGKSVDFEVTLTSLFGFDSPCTLTVSDLPSHATAYFDKNPISPTDVTTLTINTAEKEPTGTFEITITATEIGEAHTQHDTHIVLIIKESEFMFQEAFLDTELLQEEQSEGEHCPKCIVNWCKTTYPTSGDYDGDGMSDSYEMELARHFKPTLYYDDANSEITYCFPNHYDIPPYSYESGPNHGLPSDIVMDGTVYVHVRPFQIESPGIASYIEVAYWFYYTYNQDECQNGYYEEHGHDWEHIALCLSVVPDSSQMQIVSIFFAQHDGWQIRGPDGVQWTGTPGLSSVKVYIVDGAHASYPCTGERCALWLAGFCVCWENANGGQLVQIDSSKIINLYELGDSRAPNWLDYPSRWPGNSSLLGDPPYGPACGDHSYWWYNGHFVSPSLCVETWREDVPGPDNFQVSTFRNGHPLTNALYLTWNGPTNEDGFNLRRCLVSIPPNSNDPSCECIAQLGPTEYSYFDSCLDGGRTYYYELKTFRDNPHPEYRGCSWPALGQGTPSGGPCTENMTPSAPIVRDCDSCILRWDDCSWNEDGFRIELHGDTCGMVARNVEEYPVNNCCTGDKRYYHVIAFNQYGENTSTIGMPCNEVGCQPKLGCDGNQYEVPSTNWVAKVFLITLMIVIGFFFLKRKNEKKPILFFR